MRISTILLLAATTVLSLPAQVRVVATVPDLADLAERVGGELVSVYSLTKGHEDLHLVSIRPSHLVELRRADVFLELGLAAEHAWVPPLLRKARNKKVSPGGSGFVNCSAGVKPLAVPVSRSRRDAADIHPSGNPHYNLDPELMREAARNVCTGLKRVLPDHAAALDARLSAWEKELDEHAARWSKKLASLRGAAFIEYHAAWVYFAERYGLEIVAQLEPKPGLAPTPGHLKRVVETAKSRGIRLVVARPQNLDVARKVVAEVGAGTAVSLQLGSSRTGELKGWFTFMDHVVDTFADGLRG